MCINLNVMTMHWKVNRSRQILRMMASSLTTPPLLRSIRLHTTLNPIMRLIMLIPNPFPISKIEKTASLEKHPFNRKILRYQIKWIILWQKLPKFLWKISNKVPLRTTYQFLYLIRWLGPLISLLLHSHQGCSFSYPQLSIVPIQDYKNWRQKNLSLITISMKNQWRCASRQ